MATNKQLFSIQKYLSSSAVDKFKLERVFEVNKAKTPQLYNDIVNDVQFLENNGLFILIDGEDVQVKYANGIKIWSDALTLVGVEEPVEVVWDDITDKPTTFSPSAHQHDASDIDTGTFHADRIPDIGAEKITSLAEYVIVPADEITSTDTLLQAIGKLEARIVALETAGE